MDIDMAMIEISHTQKLLVLRLKCGVPGFQLIPPASEDLVLFLTLAETIDSLADEGLTVGQLPANRDDVVVRDGRYGTVVIDIVELGQELSQLLVLLGEGTLLLENLVI